jgi:hypothetical protein
MATVNYPTYPDLANKAAVIREVEGHRGGNLPPTGPKRREGDGQRSG